MIINENDEVQVILAENGHDEERRFREKWSPVKTVIMNILN